MIRNKYKSYKIFTTGIIILINFCGAMQAQAAPLLNTFRMGFTPFPPAATSAGVNESYSFITAHGNIITHHFDNGVPWPEAYAGTAFAPNITDDWAFRKASTPADVPIFLALTPLNPSRTGLANYRGTSDNMSLPGAWATYSLNDAHVKTAYLNYVQRAVDYFHPTYLAIGIESNILISHNLSQWSDYMELHNYVYNAIKTLYPSLQVFATIQYETLRGVTDESQTNLSSQVPLSTLLINSSDLLALSTYSFGNAYNPISANYFDLAKTWNKKIAIAESGSISGNTNINGSILPGNQADQNEFERFLLQEAKTDNFEFVVNFIPIDYDEVLALLPPDQQQQVGVWVRTGLMGTDRQPKLALTTWDAYLNNKTPTVGDLNLDHIVNSIDFSVLNGKWFSADIATDFNHDGVVNSLDFSMLNTDWFQTW